MTRIVLLLLLLAADVFAQPVITRGGALKKRQYQTYSTMSLFVDGSLGNDNNACTASGASACATFAGALAKVPRFIRNNVTIAIAAGTYAEAFAITDRKLTNNVSITVSGARANFTVATGTNSGSSTAGTAATTAAPATMTDSGQTWTVNNLRGRFVTFSSGALSGQTIPIFSNTATVLTLGTANSPGAGAAYTIQSPSVIFSIGSTTPFRLSALEGSGTITLSDIDFSRTGTGVNFSLAGAETLLISVNRARFIGSATNSNAILAASGSLSLTNCHVQNASGAALSCASTGSAGSGTIACTTLNTTVVAASGAAIFLNNTRQSSFSSTVAEADGSLGVVAVSGSNNARLGGAWLSCTAGASSGLSASTSSQPPTPSFVTSTGTLAISGCTDGILLYGALWLRTSTTAIASATNGVNLSSGARTDFLLQTPTFTTVTNELKLDADTYTYAFLNALVPAVISNVYGTTIIK